MHQLIFRDRSQLAGITAMAVSDTYLQYVHDLLAPLGPVSSRRMFSAVGLYCGGLFFAIISGDTLFFKVDDSNRADYEAHGMEAFRPRSHQPKVRMAYFQVPAHVLEDPEELIVWARRSLRVAASSGVTR